MEPLSAISRPGKYEVYQADSGEYVYVLQGLDVTQGIEHQPLQIWLEPQVPNLVTAYWLLIIFSALYMIWAYIAAPLWRARTI
jgi:hypothetical protein